MIVNFIVLLIYALLAIISRKHYSKYKGRENLIFKGFFGMASFIYELLWNKQSMGQQSFEKIKNNIRKTNVLSEKNLESFTVDYIKKKIAVCLLVMFVFNLLALCCGIFDGRVNNQKNIIERNTYNGTSKTQNVYFEMEGQEEVIALQIDPVQFTNMEFIERAETIFDDLETTMLSENDDKRNITSDLYLPSWDEKGELKIQYKSSNPEVITSYGLMKNDNLMEDEEVVITAKIKYLDYEATRDYHLLVKAQTGNDEFTTMDELEIALEEIEEKNRTKKNFEIPEKWNGIKLSLSKNKENQNIKMLFIGLFFVATYLVLEKSRRREFIENRNHLLEKDYSVFVNTFWLFLETGMTTKLAFTHVILEFEKRQLKKLKDNEKILINELKYAMNEIQAGADEAQVYENFGMRIGLPMYIRFMGQVSQNLRLGTKDLKHVMKDEVNMALEIKKTNSIKRGEEAATKLLFPMAMLLLIVMVVVIAPAVCTF